MNNTLRMATIGATEEDTAEINCNDFCDLYNF